MNGIVVVDKPQGMTSHDVVSFLRKKTGVKRIGHSGTLDPMARGVLPIFIGKATRVIEYAGIPEDQEAKLYRCKMKLGIETDTNDIWGKILSQNNEMPDISTIKSILKSFQGPGFQKPPMYSAVKVAGKKLYEYARKGVSVDEDLIRERNIYIKHIRVKHVDTEAREACFDVLCSKGVYIRSLCADAGRLLGCGAAMSDLIRLKSDSFSIKSAISFESLQNEEIKALLPIDAPLFWLPYVVVDDKDARAFAQGRSIAYSAKEIAYTTIRVYSSSGFIGIGRIYENAEDAKQEIKPEKVLIL